MNKLERSDSDNKDKVSIGDSFTYQPKSNKEDKPQELKSDDHQL